MVRDFLKKLKSSLGFGSGGPNQLRLANGGYWAQRPLIGNYAQPLDKNIDVGEWRTIVNASQKLFWNFGPAQGALQEKSSQGLKARTRNGAAWRRIGSSTNFTESAM
jgi:hypothetical protein